MSSQVVRIPISLIDAALRFDRCVITDELASGRISPDLTTHRLLPASLALVLGRPLSAVMFYRGELAVHEQVTIPVGITVLRKRNLVRYVSVGCICLAVSALFAGLFVGLPTSVSIFALVALLALAIWRKVILRRVTVRLTRWEEYIDLEGVSDHFKSHVDELISNSRG